MTDEDNDDSANVDAASTTTTTRHRHRRHDYGRLRGVDHDSDRDINTGDDDKRRDVAPRWHAMSRQRRRMKTTMLSHCVDWHDHRRTTDNNRDPTPTTLVPDSSPILVHPRPRPFVLSPNVQKQPHDAHNCVRCAVAPACCSCCYRQRHNDAASMTNVSDMRRNTLGLLYSTVQKKKLFIIVDLHSSL
jgi:hypothetical protein